MIMNFIYQNELRDSQIQIFLFMGLYQINLIWRESNMNIINTYTDIESVFDIEHFSIRRQTYQS